MPKKLNERLTTLVKSERKRLRQTEITLCCVPAADAPPTAIEDLQATIRRCRICVTEPRTTPLPHEPRPILRLSPKARFAVASQAPGIRAHTSGIPFDDASGERLRSWMGIGRDVFYDPERLVIAPMGFCFPGHDAAKGDLPPRRECRDAWLDQVYAAMPQLEVIAVIGLYALRYHLARLHADWPRGLGLTEQVHAWRDLYERPGRPKLIPLPHPSWRNSGWLKRHPWFEAEVLPVLRAEVRRWVVGPAGTGDRSTASTER